MTQRERSIKGELRADNASGVSGVSKVLTGKDYGRWVARMRIVGMRLSFGVYDTLEEAEAVMKIAREKKAISDDALLDWYFNELEVESKGENPMSGYNRR